MPFFFWLFKISLTGRAGSPEENRLNEQQNCCSSGFAIRMPEEVDLKSTGNNLYNLETILE